MCEHHLDDGPLICNRPDTHDPTATGGHTYAASAGHDLARTEATDD